VADAIERILEQWHRELPHLDTTAMAVFGRLARTAHQAALAVEPVFARHGVTRGEFDVLAALRRSGTPFRLRPTELSEGLMLSSGGMTKRLDRLEAAGLVRRRRNPDDRRGSLVELMPAGRAVVEKAVVDVHARERALLDALPPGARRELAALLARLADVVERAQPRVARGRRARAEATPPSGV
jgi:DNA-binding MarR family transcriptional regulator